LQTVAGTARRPLRSPRLWDIDVGLRGALEDSVKMSHHPLGVVAVVVALVAIILVTRVLLGVPVLS